MTISRQLPESVQGNEFLPGPEDIVVRERQMAPKSVSNTRSMRNDVETESPKTTLLYGEGLQKAVSIALLKMP